MLVYLIIFILCLVLWIHTTKENFSVHIEGIPEMPKMKHHLNNASTYITEKTKDYTIRKITTLNPFKSQFRYIRRMNK